MLELSNFLWLDVTDSITHPCLEISIVSVIPTRHYLIALARNISFLVRVHKITVIPWLPCISYYDNTLYNRSPYLKLPVEKCFPPKDEK